MDLLRRVRWGNVARAAALLAAVALVIAWPRLRSEPPSLPPEPALAAPAPLREEGPEFAVEQPAAKPPARPKRRRARRRPVTKRSVAKRRVARPTPRAVQERPPVQAPTPAPAPTWSPPPPQSEFGLGE